MNGSSVGRRLPVSQNLIDFKFFYHFNTVPEIKIEELIDQIIDFYFPFREQIGPTDKPLIKKFRLGYQNVT